MVEMKKLVRLMFLLLSIFICNFVKADGVILGITSAGPDFTGYPGVMQIRIEGGFDTSGCNTTYAAIRNTSNRSHLVGVLLAAYTTQKPVSIVLNPADKYSGDRCTVSRISF